MSRTEYQAPSAVQQPIARRRSNGWPVLPMRIFLAALFLFAGYAKLSYPGFFDPSSPSGLKASVDAVKHGTPVGGALGPLSDHPSLFGHITAYAEIAIGLGLLVGLLTRIAALGGIVLTLLIALSIDWGGIKQYTGSSGWFTSVDFAVAAALSVFAIGGADPISLDALIWRSKLKRRARDDDEPSFRDSELEDSRRRLAAEPDAGERTAQYQPVGDADRTAAFRPTGNYPQGTDRRGDAGERDHDLPHEDDDFHPAPTPPPVATSRDAGPGRDDERRNDENSLWNDGRREPGPSEPRPGPDAGRR